MNIAFLNQKGGVGKTTLSIHLAAALGGACKGFAPSRTLLVDTDPQGSALAWSMARPDDQPAPFDTISLPSEKIHRDLPSVAAAYDHVVIDGSPRLHKVTAATLLAVDLVVIPVQPSPYDIWGADGMVEMLGHALIYNPGLRAAFALNRKVVGTAIGREALPALAEHEGVETLEAHVCQRVAYAESAARGATVFEMSPREADKAQREMAKFARAVAMAAEGAAA